MASKRISELAAISALDDDDILAIVEDGVNKKVTVAQLRAAVNGVFSYAEKTTDTSITATTETTANTIVTAGAAVLDGSTQIEITFFSQQVQSPGGGASRFTAIVLYDAVDGGAAASIGFLGLVFNETSARIDTPVYCSRILTPAAGSHVYSARAYVNAGTGNVNAGAGGIGNEAPAYISVRKT